jgi:ABC-type multidrug transport system fused ATPase/permease subunit
VYKELQKKTESLAKRGARSNGEGWQIQSVTNFCLNALVYGFLGFKVLVQRLVTVGENGAGKTTLIKLLMRLFDPTEGRILLNGVDIREIDYRQYLHIFSTVFQDFRFFAFRIADNIVSFKKGGDGSVDGAKDQAKLRDSLVKAGLLEKIESLDKGLDTYLYKLYEEDGVELLAILNQ